MTRMTKVIGFFGMFWKFRGLLKIKMALMLILLRPGVVITYSKFINFFQSSVFYKNKLLGED